MTNVTRFQSLQLVRLRAAKLTASGAPLTGAGNGYVTDAPIDCTIKIVTEAGEDQTQKNGSGGICATYKTCDKIKRLDVAINLCMLDTLLAVFLGGCDPFMSGGNPIGWQYPSVTAACPNGICLELWTKAWDGSQQATPPFTSSQAAYWHWVLPLFKGTMGDIKMDNTIMVVPVNGTSEENNNVTANGPFDDWPTAIAQQGGVTRVGGVFLDSNIPAVTGATIAVTSADS